VKAKIFDFRRRTEALRSNYLHLSDISGMAILWEVTGGAAFSVRRSRQLDIRRWASSIWTAGGPRETIVIVVGGLPRCLLESSSKSVPNYWRMK
jgi:hypothetical protein